MMTVLQHILRVTRNYQTRPFFDFQRDDTLTQRQRLAFGGWTDELLRFAQNDPLLSRSPAGRATARPVAVP